MLSTDQSSLYHTHTSILQICFKNTYNTGFSVHLHLPAWLDVLLLLSDLLITAYIPFSLMHKLIPTLQLNLWACSILSVFPINHYYSWTSTIWTHPL